MHPFAAVREWTFIIIEDRDGAIAFVNGSVILRTIFSVVDVTELFILSRVETYLCPLTYLRVSNARRRRPLASSTTLMTRSTTRDIALAMVRSHGAVPYSVAFLNKPSTRTRTADLDTRSCLRVGSLLTSPARVLAILVDSRPCLKQTFVEHRL
jgi:hypothetical protein